MSKGTGKPTAKARVRTKRCHAVVVFIHATQYVHGVSTLFPRGGGVEASRAAGTPSLSSACCRDEAPPVREEAEECFPRGGQEALSAFERRTIQQRAVEDVLFGGVRMGGLAQLRPEPVVGGMSRLSQQLKSLTRTNQRTRVFTTVHA